MRLIRNLAFVILHRSLRTRSASAAQRGFQDVYSRVVRLCAAAAQCSPSLVDCNNLCQQGCTNYTGNNTPQGLACDGTANNGCPNPGRIQARTCSSRRAVPASHVLRRLVGLCNKRAVLQQQLQYTDVAVRRQLRAAVRWNDRRQSRVLLQLHRRHAGLRGAELRRESDSRQYEQQRG